MLTTEAEQYRPEALALAEAEAGRRGLSIEAPPPAGATMLGAAREAVEVARSAMGPCRYATGGKPIVCPHCHGDVFEEQAVLLNTRLRTFLSLDWLDPGATALVCRGCGIIQWLAKPPERRGVARPGDGRSS